MRGSHFQVHGHAAGRSIAATPIAHQSADRDAGCWPRHHAGRWGHKALTATGNRPTATMRPQSSMHGQPTPPHARPRH